MSTEKQAELISILTKISNAHDMQCVLNVLMTEKELKAFANRVQILKLLDDSVPQREIAESLNVGLVTVTRGSHAYNEKDFSVLKKYTQ